MSGGLILFLIHIPVKYLQEVYQSQILILKKH